MIVYGVEALLNACGFTGSISRMNCFGKRSSRRTGSVEGVKEEKRRHENQNAQADKQGQSRACLASESLHLGSDVLRKFRQRS